MNNDTVTEAPSGEPTLEDLIDALARHFPEGVPA